jgi:hypothetical protein
MSKILKKADTDEEFEAKLRPLIKSSLKNHPLVWFKLMNELIVPYLHGYLSKLLDTKDHR